MKTLAGPALIQSIIIAAALLLPALAGCGNEQNDFLVDESSGKKKVAVCTNEFLTVRSEPYILAPKLAFLEKGEQVEVINQSRKPERIGRTKAYWYKIKKKNSITGWAHGSHLTLLEVADEEQLATAQKDIVEAERQKVEKLLKGKYFSVDNQGLYTSEKIYFFGEGIYAAGRLNQKLKDGAITIIPEEKVIEFSDGTSVGNKLSYVIAGQQLTLYGKRWGKTIRLVRGAVNPWSEEMGGTDILPEKILEMKNGGKPKPAPKDNKASDTKASNQNKSGQEEQ